MPVQIASEFMSGCREFFGTRGSRCDATETERIKMNLDQPCRITVSCLYLLLSKFVLSPTSIASCRITQN